MIPYQKFKRDKFLLNCSSFLLVSFLSNKQLNFLIFKEFLYLHKLKIKFLKSKSINGCLKNYIKSDLIINLKQVSSCPLFLIKPQIEKEFLPNLLKLEKKKFIENKIFLLFCFYRGQTYFPNYLTLLKKQNPLNFLINLYNSYINNLKFFNFCDLFLLNLFFIYLNNNNQND